MVSLPVLQYSLFYQSLLALLHYSSSPSLAGAFYGPKIDIKVFDALGRRHQCATIQLDFQLPLRFNLRYKAPGKSDAEGSADAGAEGGEASSSAAPAGGEPTPAPAAAAPSKGAAATASDSSASPASAPAAPPPASGSVAAAIERVKTGAMDDLPEGFERPVIIHRAILGSVERMMAVLIEHTGGKWPFWLSPRQIQVVPVAQQYIPYARAVRDRLHAEGFYADVNDTTQTLNKKVREAQVAQYNYILVVGEKERDDNSVNIRTRDNVVQGTKGLEEAVAMFKQLAAEYK